MTTQQRPATLPRPLVLTKARLMHIAAWRAEHPGQDYPSFMERWGVQRDDGAGPLSRLISLCPEGLVGYTIRFDSETQRTLDTMPRPQRMAEASALVDAVLALVPDEHRMGSMVLRFGSGWGWHIHGLLDARAVSALVVLPEWNLKISPLPTLDDVRGWAGYCVKHARKRRHPARSWKLDIVADRLLRDRAESRAMGLTYTKFVRWFGLPSKVAWMTDQRWNSIRAIVAAIRMPRPQYPARASHPAEAIVPAPPAPQQVIQGSQPTA